MVKKVCNKKTTLKHKGGGLSEVWSRTTCLHFFWTLPYSVEMTTFFQRTFGDSKTCVKIENKIFLLFTQKIAYYFIQYSLHCTKILCSTLWSRLSAVKCIISTKKNYKLFF